VIVPITEISHIYFYLFLQDMLGMKREVGVHMVVGAAVAVVVVAAAAVMTDTKVYIFVH